MKFVEEAYEAVGPPPCTSAAAAFQELCGSPPGYGSDVLAGRVSYKPGATALPPPHSAFAQGAELLDGADLDAWVNWQDVLLRTPAELAAALHEEPAPEIFTDPALTRSPKRYAESLVQLAQRGLIKFGEAAAPTVGVFFVKKSDGRQRLIIDTRAANMRFRKPWHTSLPSAASLAALEVGEEAELHVKQVDVGCAFYRIQAPPGMEELFILPSAPAEALEAAGAELGANLKGGLVSPRLQVLGMGFSWALYFCQRMVESCVRRAGIPTEHMCSDRQIVPSLKEAGVVCATYVDGVAAVSEDEKLADETIKRVSEVLAEANLDAGPKEECEEGQIFVGLKLDKASGRVSIPSRRLWRLKLALEHAAQSKWLTGRQLSSLVGGRHSAEESRRTCQT